MATATTAPVYSQTARTVTAVTRNMTLEEWVAMARATMPDVTEEQRRSIQRRRLAHARQEATPESDRTYSRVA